MDARIINHVSQHFYHTCRNVLISHLCWFYFGTNWFIEVENLSKKLGLGCVKNPFARGEKLPAGGHQEGEYVGRIAKKKREKDKKIKIKEKKVEKRDTTENNNTLLAICSYGSDCPKSPRPEVVEKLMHSVFNTTTDPSRH